MGARVRRGLSWSPHLAVPTAVRSEETSTFPSLLVSEAGRRVWPITRTVSAVPAGHRQAARGCGCGCGCGRSKGGVSSCRSKAAAQGAGRPSLLPGGAPSVGCARGEPHRGGGGAPAWRRPLCGSSAQEPASACSSGAARVWPRPSHLPSAGLS